MNDTNPSSGLECTRTPWTRAVMAFSVIWTEENIFLGGCLVSVLLLWRGIVTKRTLIKEIICLWACLQFQRLSPCQGAWKHRGRDWSNSWMLYFLIHKQAGRQAEKETLGLVWAFETPSLTLVTCLLQNGHTFLSLASSSLTKDQACEYMCLRGPFSFKPSQWSYSTWMKRFWFPEYYLSMHSPS